LARSAAAMSDWSDEETDNPVYADRRSFYKVEKWSRDGLRVELLCTPATASIKRGGYLSGQSSTSR
jgi:hypothetical protein